MIFENLRKSNYSECSKPVKFGFTSEGKRMMLSCFLFGKSLNQPCNKGNNKLFLTLSMEIRLINWINQFLPVIKNLPEFAPKKPDLFENSAISSSPLIRDVKPSGN